MQRPSYLESRFGQSFAFVHSEIYKKKRAKTADFLKKDKNTRIKISGTLNRK
jgi:hypothetical protein